MKKTRGADKKSLNQCRGLMVRKTQCFLSALALLQRYTFRSLANPALIEASAECHLRGGGGDYIGN